MDLDVSVVPLHKNTKFLQKCCKLINSEWKRSETARMRSLESSCDTLPTSLILINPKINQLIGHLKLSQIPSIKAACFVESVVVKRELRGKGYGTLLMLEAEKYCRNCLRLQTIYLSTQGQEEFYRKLGYTRCAPISIYGSYSITKTERFGENNNKIDILNAVRGPTPPPLPNLPSNNQANAKVYMKKDLN